MRIGVLSDIHANLPAMRAALELFEREGVDQLVNLGDLVQYGPSPGECVRLAMETEMSSIQGNCDRAVARGRKATGDAFVNTYWEDLAAEHLVRTRGMLDSRSRAWLRDLPDEIRFEFDGLKILFTHGLPGVVAGSLPGSGADELFDILLQRNSCNVLVVGHTHSPALVRRPAGWILNPGSVGGGTLPAAGTAMILEPSRKGGPCPAWVRLDYDFEGYEADCRSAGVPDVFTRSIALGRDPRGQWHTDDTYWRQRWAGQ